MTREEKNKIFEKIGEVVPTITFNIHKVDIDDGKHNGVLITSKYDEDFNTVIKSFLKKQNYNAKKVLIHDVTVNPFLDKEEVNTIILRRAYTLPEMYREVGDIMSKFDDIPDFILINNLDFMGISEILLMNFKSF